MILASSTPIHVESLISDLAFILILAAVTTVVFKMLKQPVVLGYIVAGFLASPNFEYLPSVTTAENINFWAEIGIIILLFSLGIEFSFKKLVNAGGSAVVTAMIIIAGMMGVGFALGKLMGFTTVNSLFLGGMLSMSSTTIILKALSDLNLRHKKFASQVLAVLIVEDLFAVLLMVVLSSIAINNTVAGGELLLSVAKLAFFLIMWFLVGVYILPSLLNGIRRYLSNETLLVISMGLCLGMAVFSVMCGFSLALGAFVMGSILAGTSFAERIDKVTAPVKDLFGSVFFISVGMMVNPEIITQYWSEILILSITVIAGMMLFGTFGMLVTGQSLLVSMEAGFSLVQIGEFSFIIATLGTSLGVLEASMYPIVVAVSVITTFFTPYFIKMAPGAYRIVEKRLPAKVLAILKSYSDRAAASSAGSSTWAVLLKRFLWRVVVYSVILVAITLLSVRFLLPYLEEVIPYWGKLLCAVITLLAMSPFLVALTYHSSPRSQRDAFLRTHTRFEVPVIVMYIFRFLLSLVFVVNILSQIYSQRVGWILGLVIFLLLIIFVGRNARHRLNRIESKFLSNLNERDLRRTGKDNNLIGDMHLAYMEVGYGCPFVGETLKDAEIGRRYGANVVNIQRASTFIPLPHGDMRLFPGDVIGVVGTDDQLQMLLSDVEKPLPEDQTTTDQPSDVKLTSVVLTDRSPLIGCTVATSGLRAVYATMLVSVERDNSFIPLTSELRFRAADILWLVGSHKNFARIAGRTAAPR